jgi:ATP-dependent protease ClpP protease subunit
MQYIKPRQAHMTVLLQVPENAVHLIMIHQPSGGSWSCTDMEINLSEMLKLKDGTM